MSASRPPISHSSGVLVSPLNGRSVDVTYVGHHIAYPRANHQRSLVEEFVAWLRVDLAAKLK